MVYSALQVNMKPCMVYHAPNSLNIHNILSSFMCRRLWTRFKQVL